MACRRDGRPLMATVAGPHPDGVPVPLSDIADPSRDLRLGLLIAAFFFVGLLGWAAFTRLDAAAYTSGTLVVSGQRQSVQHRDGGVVAAIHVRDGQRVVRGALLLQLAAAEVRAQERALASQAIQLLARRARLEAEQFGTARIVPPAAFAALTGADRAEAVTALRLQDRERAARTAVLSARRAALGTRVDQSAEQGLGYGEQADSAREQLRLIDQQIGALAPLVERGFVSQTRMRELERARALLRGQRGQYAASVAQTRSAARENRVEMLEAERGFIERAASELRDVETGLGEILPRWTAARDQLARTAIRAPATGIVIGLSVFTPGGVIAAGQKLMDIVPERTELMVETRITPDDADDVQVGQTALVRFSGLHERRLSNLEGRVTRLSADSFVDEKTGQPYFTAEIRIAPGQLHLIRNLRGRDFRLRAGMPADILIPLQRRTALDYALEPLIGSFWSSFREH
jgi:HlyD family secretion protein